MLHTLLLVLAVIFLPASQADVLPKSSAILNIDTSTGYSLVDPTVSQQHSISAASQLGVATQQLPSGSQPTSEIHGRVELAGTGYCSPYSATSASSIPCGFTVCGGATITATTCPSYGGSFTGDTVLRLLQNGVQVNSNDDYGGYQCSYVTSSISASSSAICTAVSISQTCFSASVCSGTTYYSITLNAGSYVVNPAPSVAPTRAPTASPTVSSTVNGLVGSFAVNSGPAWGTVPPAYSCQQACAVKFGGSANDYQGSTSPNYITGTCTYDQYSGSTTVLTDSYSNCATYLYGCYSAYVYDHAVSTLNYCYNSNAVSRSPSRVPTVAPTFRAPTRLPTRIPTIAPTPTPTYVSSLSPTRTPGSVIAVVGSFRVNSGPVWTSHPATYTCQQACAYLFGGSAADYIGSISESYASATCYSDRYGGSSGIISDSYSNCATYYTTGCYSAYISDNGISSSNYCWSSNAASSNPARLPTISPTRSPTRIPTRSPTSNTLPGSLIGSFIVNTGNVWSSNAPAYSCKAACAAIYGGSASDYSGSISAFGITNTCYYDRYYVSPGTVGYLLSDSYSTALCVYYTSGSATDGCYSAYVSDHSVSSRNYCYSASNNVRSPTLPPTIRPPTQRPTTRPPTQRPTLSFTTAPTMSLSSPLFCTPYTSPGTQEVLCAFTACGSFDVAASTCPQFGGSFTGDTLLILYDANHNAIVTRDDYSGSRCTYIEQTYVAGTEGVCSSYYIAQRCYGTTACTGTTAYFIGERTLTVETVYASVVRNTLSLPEIRPQSLWVRNASLLAIGDVRGYVWNVTQSNNPVAIATPAADTEAVYGITGDSQGNVYFTQYSQCLIKQISAVDSSIRVIAGLRNNCTQMVSNSKKASQSTLSRPWAIQSTVLSTGALQLCFSEHQGNMLRCFDATHDGPIQVKAGMIGASGYNGDNIAALSAKLSAFTSFYIDSSTGDFYLADTGNSRIRRVSSTTGLISTVGSASQYSYPNSIVGDGAGRLYNSFADGSNVFSIRQTSNPASPSSLTVQTYAGSGVEGGGLYNGPALQMALDGNVLLFADPTSNAGVIYLVEPDQRNIVKLYRQTVTYSDGNFPPTQTPTAAPTIRDTTLQMTLSLSFSGFTSSILSGGEQQVLSSTVAALLGINSQYVSVQSISVASASRRLRGENEKESLGVVVERVPGTAELTPEAASELAAAAAQQQQLSMVASGVSLSQQTLVQPEPQSLSHHVHLQTYSLDIETEIEVPLTGTLFSYRTNPSALADSFSSTLQTSISTGSFDSSVRIVATNNGITTSSSLFSSSATTMTVTSVTILTNAPTLAPTSSPGSDDDSSTMPGWGWAIVAVIILAIICCVGGSIYLCCYRCRTASTNNNPAANGNSDIQSVPATIELRTYQPNPSLAPVVTSVSVVQPVGDFRAKQQAANDALGNQPSFVVYPAVTHQSPPQQQPQHHTPQAHVAPPLPPVLVTAVVVQPAGPIHLDGNGPVPSAPPSTVARTVGQVQFLSLGPCDNTDGFMNV